MGVKPEGERAIQDFDEAIRLNPQLAIAYYSRGLAYHDGGTETDSGVASLDGEIGLPLSTNNKTIVWVVTLS